jgi:CRP-like cAMP-binding protein
MLAGAPRWFDAVAATPIIALRGYREALLDVLEDHHDMAMDYLAAIAGIHIENMQARLELEAAALSDGARLAG